MHSEETKTSYCSRARNVHVQDDIISHISGVSKKFGEWYQKTNKTEDTNILTLLAFKIITILHNTLLATFIQLLETVSKGLVHSGQQSEPFQCQETDHVLLVIPHVRGMKPAYNQCNSHKTICTYNELTIHLNIPTHL
jgi:hypothetical protein